MPIQKSGEDYLEAIYILKSKQGSVRSIDVAHHFDYSKPSISRAVGNLKQDGLLEVGEGGELNLTPAGLEIAKNIYERHTILTEVLAAIGVPADVAAEDACRVEHVISEETFRQIKKIYHQREKDGKIEPGPPAAKDEDRADKKKKKKKKK